MDDTGRRQRSGFADRGQPLRILRCRFAGGCDDRSGKHQPRGRAMRWRLQASCTGLALLALSGGMALGDEGLWTFDKFPSNRVVTAYGFAPDAAWLERVRIGSVRLDSGCSAGLVSAQGLIETVHHCVED